MVVPVLLLTLGAVAVLLGRRRPWPRRPGHVANSHSPVAFQHLQLYQGGLISQAELLAAKSELRQKMAVGGITAMESYLRPGLEFVVNVRALSEIGSDEAARVLEQQLGRRISNDPLEQSWYLIDLAHALRSLNRQQSLPSLLECGEKVVVHPLGYLFAAELLAFPNFTNCLLDPLTHSGQIALRILRSAMEGIRRGYVPVTLYAESQIGDVVHRLAETCPDTADPLLARVFLEAMRHSRRSYSSSPELREDGNRRQAVRTQALLLRDAEPILREYLHGIDEDLTRMLPSSTFKEQADILAVIAELHADTESSLLGLIVDEEIPGRIRAIECLQWSSSPKASWFLKQRARTAISGDFGKTSWRRRKNAGSRTIKERELLAVLRALRGHAGDETEELLIEYCGHPSVTFRIAALRSLGWWEPIRRQKVLDVLHTARISREADVRMAAIAALARLGECAALQVLRDSLTNENPDSVHHAIEIVASEGLTWLWPDLDLLTEADDPAVAHHAWEAIEVLRESILGTLE